MVTIYIIKFDELTNEAYIGITTKTLKERLSRHIRDIKKKDTIKTLWLSNNIDKGFKLSITKIHRCSNKKALELESIYIKTYKELGYTLYNSNNGGGGLLKHSDETKIKISLKNIGRTLTEEQYTKLIIANRNKKPFTEEHRNNISLSNKGKVLSKGHIENLKNNHKGNKGKTFSLEHRSKISNSLKGKKYGPKKESIRLKTTGINNKSSIPVVGVNKITNKIINYDSAGEAYRDLYKKGIIISRSGIYKSISGRSASGGYYWYKTEVYKNTINKNK